MLKLDSGQLFAITFLLTRRDAAGEASEPMSLSSCCELSVLVVASLGHTASISYLTAGKMSARLMFGCRQLTIACWTLVSFTDEIILMRL